MPETLTDRELLLKLAERLTCEDTPEDVDPSHYEDPPTLPEVERLRGDKLAEQVGEAWKMIHDHLKTDAPANEPTRTDTFRMNTVTLNVLSESSIEGWDIGTILSECDEGELVMHSTAFLSRELDGKGMADALTEAGSDPGFFRLDNDGNPVGA